jgi:hypothetical protein
MAYITKKATKAAVYAAAKATQAKLVESRLITQFLETRHETEKDTLSALDEQLSALHQHMSAAEVLPVDLGKPGIPPSSSSETKEILLASLDESGYVDEDGLEEGVHDDDKSDDTDNDTNSDTNNDDGDTNMVAKLSVKVSFKGIYSCPQNNVLKSQK